MKVKMPFKERFREPMLTGFKTMTSRTRKYGKVGDTFDAFGATFIILDVPTIKLETIAYTFYDDEGCESPEDFIEVWKQIHPRKGFVPAQMVYVHVFEKMDSEL